MFGCYLNSGQTCSALTRMLVPRDKLAEVEELAAGAAAGFAPGDPFEQGKLLGPLVSSVQRDRVRDYINKGIEEGAKLVVGGPDAPEGLEQGLLRPADGLLRGHPGHDHRQGGDLRPGPVHHPLRHRGGGHRDRQRHALRAGRRRCGAATPPGPSAWRAQMRTGQVDINGGQFNPSAPFGGYKQSGIGRERGKYGLEEFVETKSMQR